MTAVAAARWEVGGEFHLPVEPPGPYHRWPEGALWYSLGRHTLQALLPRIGAPRLWLPDYFCGEVARSWSALADVEVYEDDPRWPEPRWETLRPGPRDAVVAVNYFGVRQAAPWRAWRERTTCVLVEDHAHDPASEWATASTAEYAFSSLRKTLPVPDGAILWSPLGLALPEQPAGGADGSELKLAAMLLKGEYLAGGDDELKERFRRLQLDGEERLARSAVAGASAATRESLVRGVPLPWRARRSENAGRLIAALHGWELAEPLFTEWSAGAAPLGAVFVFQARDERDRVRGVLREAGVYCPVHWADAAHERAPARVRELAERILTIPTDWRYSAADMARIASLARSA
ncbi:MAG TPA: hypothetical protein VG144_06285 [Gaiellaceae bacterium]|nr:hypothetical protein [Gaiellaceae bacterium]